MKPNTFACVFGSWYLLIPTKNLVLFWVGATGSNTVKIIGCHNRTPPATEPHPHYTRCCARLVFVAAVTLELLSSIPFLTISLPPVHARRRHRSTPSRPTPFYTPATYKQRSTNDAPPPSFFEIMTGPASVHSVEGIKTMQTDAVPESSPNTRLVRYVMRE